MSAPNRGRSCAEDMAAEGGGGWQGGAIPAGAGGRPASPDQEHDFLEEPPRDYYCAVSLELLLEPFQTGCCGHHLSKEVVERLQREGKPCPMCNRPNFPTHPDIYMRRKIMELQVRCRYSGGGCGWTGDLSNRETHTRTCPKQPWSCPHCQFSGLREAARAHTERCERVPVDCPNNCSARQVPRCQLSDHLEKDCLLQPVACTFSHVGCTERLTRSELPGHVQNMQQYHTMLMCSANLDLTRQLNEKLTEKDAQIQTLQGDIACLKRELGERVQAIEAGVAAQAEWMESNQREERDEEEESQPALTEETIKTVVAGQLQEMEDRLLQTVRREVEGVRGVADESSRLAVQEMAENQEKALQEMAEKQGGALKMVEEKLEAVAQEEQTLQEMTKNQGLAVQEMTKKQEKALQEMAEKLEAAREAEQTLQEMTKNQGLAVQEMAKNQEKALQEMTKNQEKALQEMAEKQGGALQLVEEKLQETVRQAKQEITKNQELAVRDMTAKQGETLRVVQEKLQEAASKAEKDRHTTRENTMRWETVVKKEREAAARTAEESMKRILVEVEKTVVEQVKSSMSDVQSFVVRELAKEAGKREEVKREVGAVGERVRERVGAMETLIKATEGKLVAEMAGVKTVVQATEKKVEEVRGEQRGSEEAVPKSSVSPQQHRPKKSRNTSSSSRPHRSSTSSADVGSTDVVGAALPSADVMSSPPVVPAASLFPVSRSRSTSEEDANRVPVTATIPQPMLPLAIHSLPLQLPGSKRLPPCHFFIKNFSRLKEGNKEWRSEPFFSREGYKMCLGVWPNGFRSGAGTHVSVEFYKMKDANTDKLKWNVKLPIHVRIFNCRTGVWEREHVNGETFTRSKVSGEFETSGYAQSHKLIAHDDLEPYLHDDTFMIQVYKFELKQ